MTREMRQIPFCDSLPNDLMVVELRLACVMRTSFPQNYDYVFRLECWKIGRGGMGGRWVTNWSAAVEVCSLEL